VISRNPGDIRLNRVPVFHWGGQEQCSSPAAKVMSDHTWKHGYSSVQ